MLDNITADVWKIVHDAFIKPINIAFDGHVFPITKKLQGETVEPFYGKHKVLAGNCFFEGKEETRLEASPELI